MSLPHASNSADVFRDRISPDLGVFGFGRRSVDEGRTWRHRDLLRFAEADSGSAEA
jgi:hypothetical protein